MQRKHKVGTRRRILMALIGAVQMSLLAAAQWDLLKRPSEQVRGSKWLWRGIVLINFVGPIAYFVAGRRGASPIEVQTH